MPETLGSVKEGLSSAWGEVRGHGRLSRGRDIWTGSYIPKVETRAERIIQERSSFLLGGVPVRAP